MATFATELKVPFDDNVKPLHAEELRKINAYWRACNYLCAGMLYLRKNPLLRSR